MRGLSAFIHSPVLWRIRARSAAHPPLLVQNEAILKFQRRRGFFEESGCMPVDQFILISTSTILFITSFLIVLVTGLTLFVLKKPQIEFLFDLCLPQAEGGVGRRGGRGGRASAARRRLRFVIWWLEVFLFYQAGQKRKAWVSSGLSDYPKTIIVIMAILALMVIMGHGLHDDCGRHGHTGLHCHHWSYSPPNCQTCRDKERELRSTTSSCSWTKVKLMHIIYYMSHYIYYIE